MEKLLLNVSFYLSVAGSISAKLNIPKSFLDKLKVTQEERTIEVTLDEENQEIIIRKKK